MRHEKLTLNIENDPSIKKMFKTVIELIPQIPALNNLIKQATLNGPITVDFVTKAEEKTSGSFQQHGQICGNHKTIQRSIRIVKEGQSFAQMFETFVFELCNAKNAKFELFGKDAIKTSDFQDRESFALATEFAEYMDTYVPSREILKAIFSNAKTVSAFHQKGLKLSPHEIRHLTSDPFCSFNDWWQQANRLHSGRSYSHADIYRQEFDKKSNKPLVFSKRSVQPTQPVQSAPQRAPRNDMPKHPACSHTRAKPTPQQPNITLRWDARRQNPSANIYGFLFAICNEIGVSNWVPSPEYRIRAF